MKLVTYNRKYLGLSGLVLIILLFGCKKQSTDYDKGSIVLTALDASNGIELQWDNVNSNDFIRYEIYRSSSLIPDPTSKTPINPSFLIGTISNSDNHFFVDSLGSGSNYYRIQVVMKYRNLISNNIQKKNGISFEGTFSETGICRELHLMYILNSGGQFTVYDYKNDQILIKNKPLNISRFTIGKNEFNEPAIFGSPSFTTSNIIEFNATTLDQTKVHALPVLVNYYEIGNGVLYLNYNGDSIVTYNLANDTRIGGVACNGAYIMHLSDNMNSLLVTTSGLNQVSYYNIGANKLPVLEYNTNDTYNLMSFCKFSPNGNYILTQNGDLLGHTMNYIGKIQSTAFSSFVNFAFTQDEQYVLGNQQTSINLYKLDDQHLITNYSISNNFFNSPNIFVDNKSLYIILNTFDPLTGQTMVSIKTKLLDI